MRLLISAIGVLASLVLLASSASMNYLFMYSLGKTEMESYVMSAASVGADVLKASLPFFLCWAYLNGRFVFTLLSGALFIALIGLSLLSASSFILGSRIAVSGSQDELNADYRAAQEDLRKATLKRDDLVAHRASNLIAAELASAKKHRRWTSTTECTDATVSASKIYCDQVATLQAELQAAIDHARLSRNINRLKKEVERLRDIGAGQGGDPQIGLMARVFNVERDGLTLWINGFIAIVIELGSDFGLFFATSWGVKPSRNRSEGTQTDEEALELNAQSMAEELAFYCLDRLHPAQGNRESVPVMDIYGDYVAWSENRGDQPGSVALFLESFGEIAERSGLAIKGTVCTNIRIGTRIDPVAA